MTDDNKDESEKPTVRVVSNNLNVDKTRPIKFARTLAVAAAMLRAIAGSDGTAAALRNDL
jgi:hypothetical protein